MLYSNSGKHTVAAVYLVDFRRRLAKREMHSLESKHGNIIYIYI